MRTIEAPVTLGVEDLEVRRLTVYDLDEAKILNAKLADHLAASPIFLYHRREEPESIKAHFLGDGVCSAAAFRNGRIVGCLRGTLHKEDVSETVADPEVMGIDFAYVAPEARGCGVGTILLAEVLRWGKRKGMRSCSVDFESANTSARRFWLRHFEPVCCSYIRSVDSRVTWRYAPG